jgi:peptidyl-tRNA hydrolase, PTH1 family
VVLIAGLGNPGEKYCQTRHNLGFMAIDFLVSRFNAKSIQNKTFKGFLYRCESALLLQPTTFMNLSGESISSVVKFYKVRDLIVIHDDLDLPFGALRFKRGGGHGGHNGLKSIDSHVCSDYVRVRGGIGRPLSKYEISEYVLQPFEEMEKMHIDSFVENVAYATWALTTNSLEDVRTRFSQKRIILSETEKNQI